MKVLYIAAECKPFSKVGGVGDVAGELPLALQEQGVDIEIVTPLYEGGSALLSAEKLAQIHETRYRLPFRDQAGETREETVDLYRWKPDRDFRVPVSFVANPTYFGGKYAKPYIVSEFIPYFDDALRFSFFSQACLQLIRERKPDIVHINDWPLGTLFGWMVREGLPAKRVLTVHNIGYQGNLGIQTVKDWKLADLIQDPQTGPLFLDPHVEWNSVNALRLGLELSDRVNTVSPTYSREMLQPEDPERYFEGGKGLEAVTCRLEKEGKLVGILNGFEYKSGGEASAFERTLEQKTAMKQALGKDFKDPDAFLLGFVGRAVEQKFKLLAENLEGRSVLEHILDLPGVNVAIVANGVPEYEQFLGRIKALGQENCSITIAFDKSRAEQISKGSDVFLMPSLFEPCGITQMESLSNATPPLVRWTGGLVDTVIPHTQPDGTGFGFDGDTREEVLLNLIHSVREALALFRDHREDFKALQRRGYAQRFLWSTSANEYIEKLYRPVL